MSKKRTTKEPLWSTERALKDMYQKDKMEGLHDPTELFHNNLLLLCNLLLRPTDLFSQNIHNRSDIL